MQDQTTKKKAAGRVIFSLSFNGSRLEKTFFPTKIEHALVSYYYIRAKGDNVSLPILRRVKEKCKNGVLFIDSGIYTLKAQFLGVGIISKPGLIPKEVTDAAIKKSMGNLPYFVKFAADYAKWLAAHDDLYDWAFDLDVDQFLGVEIADRFYEHLKKKIPNPRKIVRIWHQTRKYADWVRWCESGDFDYLCIEGGSCHDRDYDFYRRFLDKAHEHNIKVHILALTDAKFLEHVDVDTVDSSSWMVGSRYGFIITPFANKVSFSRDHVGEDHWRTIPKETRHKITEWMKEDGIDTDITHLENDWTPRELACIKYYLECDKPFDKSKGIRRTGIMIE